MSTRLTETCRSNTTFIILGNLKRLRTFDGFFSITQIRTYLSRNTFRSLVLNSVVSFLCLFLVLHVFLESFKMSICPIILYIMYELC